MRKRIVGRAQQEAVLADQDWLNVERLADVEVTSEDPRYPIEAALVRAYQTNPTLNAQRAQVRSADESVPQALSGYRPTVAVTGR